MNERTNERRLIDGTVKGEKEGRKERKFEFGCGKFNSSSNKTVTIEHYHHFKERKTKQEFYIIFLCVVFRSHFQLFFFTLSR